MTKLSNGTQYNNSKLPVEFAEYLVQNGFEALPIKDGVCFHKEKRIKLFAKQDCIDLFKYNPELEHNQWAFHQSHSGISSLNFFGWIMLMHIMNVLSIKQFLNNVAKADYQHAAEANYLIQNVINYQLPAPTYKA